MNICFELPDRRQKKMRKSVPGWVLPVALWVLLFGRIAFDCIVK